MTERVVRLEEEAHHHVVEDVSLYRLYRAMVPFGEWTDFHRHEEDTVYVSLSRAKVGMVNWDKPEEMNVGWKSLGEVFWMENRETPQIHRVGCLEGDVASFLGVEIKRRPKGEVGFKPGNELHCNGYTLAYQSADVRVYHLRLPPSSSTGVHVMPHPSLIVAASAMMVDGEPSIIKLKQPGDFAWIPSSSASCNIANPGDNGVFHAVILQFPTGH